MATWQSSKILFINVTGSPHFVRDDEDVIKEGKL